MRNSTSTEVVAATTKAATAAIVTAATTEAERAGWLRALADVLDANAAELIEIADRESHLGVPRLTGEVARTSGQLRLFADVILEGSYLEVIIDHAEPDAAPPRPDLRRMLRAIGPVAVFAASNFPFAFSVLGGDTASALATGSPVIVKAHPGHEELSARTAELAIGALRQAGAPDGTFGIVYGMDAGSQLVTDPRIAAASFTGSLRGGRALYDLAAARPAPIPFYGELGSLNPVVITAAAVETRGAELAAGLIGSFTLGVGQFCTKPGVVFVPEGVGAEGAGFEQLVIDALPAPASAPMLDERIASAFAAGMQVIETHASVRVLSAPGSVASGSGSAGPLVGSPRDRLPLVGSPLVGSTTVADLLANADTLLEERFGPFTLLVSYRDASEVIEAIAAIGGSLTGTVHAEATDDIAAITDALARTCGRVLFAGWPTGVSVAWSQNHGGPWPSTTASIHTSVGATAVRRFLRPFAFQSAPANLLPAALRDGNPLGIPRRVDGVPGRA
ncbi:MAG: NADP-dependent aldehyde dehydrogenase [Actinomycetota bacterium]|nr:NADP-dependent aldehyde dehydrogenase [Actinomycetota bacterium]